MAIALILCFACLTGLSLTTDRFISEEEAPGSFCLFSETTAAPICVETNDWPGVIRAARDLQTDIERVSGTRPALLHNISNAATAFLIGTIGKSELIGALVRQHRLDVSGIEGKWESFVCAVVDRPLPGVERALVIAGSDKRGTIYGIYDLCEQLGVSPWHWWADVPARKHQKLFVAPGRHQQGPPAVKYRGIFINDEGPALMTWARERYGELNHGMYTNVFELILRLKGNFLWPAMWDNSFATDDPLNAKLADEYGVVISTSHHEPMMRAWKEWERAGNRKGSWDYSKNSGALREYWREGLRRTKDYEKVITLGMRGDGDEPMSETESVALLERIVRDQRQIISQVVSPNVQSVPQVWALYKEVQGYYERGMRVPDDVTLLWCDDNWGNIRRLPTEPERSRPGGAGIYYHLDYVGGPRNYKWLNTVPITKIQEQMSMAWQFGADRIWVVNVGDIKPLEFPLEFFLTLAWAPDQWPAKRLAEYTRLWAEREFGKSRAAEIADVISKYTKYNGRRKPELLEPGTYSLVNYREAERVLQDWRDIANLSESIYSSLPQDARDAFYELVLHPVKASATVAELYITGGRNRMYAAQGRPSANELAERAKSLFKQDAELSSYFNHELSGGKWNHMMDQTHIGYTYWQQPDSNTIPALAALTTRGPVRMCVAREGSPAVLPTESSDGELPGFDIFNQQSHFFEVFFTGCSRADETKREASETQKIAIRGKDILRPTKFGSGPTEFSIRATAPWAVLTGEDWANHNENRFGVTIDWPKAPEGRSKAVIVLTSPQSDSVSFSVNAFKPALPDRGTVNGFVEADGFVSIEAEHYTAKHDTEAARWELLPDYGRTLSAMTITPATVTSIPVSGKAPELEYAMRLFSTGRVAVTCYLAPALNVDPGRGLSFGISFDDQPAQEITAVPKGYYVDNGNRDWEESVRNNCRQLKSIHTLNASGRHVLKFRMIDPGVVLEKIVVDTGGVKPSYLGPPESFHR